MKTEEPLDWLVAKIEGRDDSIDEWEQEDPPMWGWFGSGFACSAAGYWMLYYVFLGLLYWPNGWIGAVLMLIALGCAAAGYWMLYQAWQILVHEKTFWVAGVFLIYALPCVLCWLVYLRYFNFSEYETGRVLALFAIVAFFPIVGFWAFVKYRRARWWITERRPLLKWIYPTRAEREANWLEKRQQQTVFSAIALFMLLLIWFEGGRLYVIEIQSRNDAIDQVWGVGFVVVVAVVGICGAALFEAMYGSENESVNTPQSVLKEAVKTQPQPFMADRKPDDSPFDIPPQD